MSAIKFKIESLIWYSLFLNSFFSFSFFLFKKMGKKWIGPIPFMCKSSPSEKKKSNYKLILLKNIVHSAIFYINSNKTCIIRSSIESRGSKFGRANVDPLKRMNSSYFEYKFRNFKPISPNLWAYEERQMENVLQLGSMSMMQAHLRSVLMVDGGKYLFVWTKLIN